MRAKLLTARERQTLGLFLRGGSEKEVGHQLGISVNTVHVYARSLYQRFDVNSRSQLLSLFLDIGSTSRTSSPPNHLDHSTAGGASTGPPLGQRLLDLTADVERAAADALLRGAPWDDHLSANVRLALQKLKTVSELFEGAVPVDAEHPRQRRQGLPVAREAVLKACDRDAARSASSACASHAPSSSREL